ncbi:hypothetical protein [Tautonia marina]|nr:hypothetical protein [Tautonia marina]
MTPQAVVLKQTIADPGWEHSTGQMLVITGNGYEAIDPVRVVGS